MQAAELAAAVDGQAVVAAVAVEPDADVIDHLREGERDHDEIDAARAQESAPTTSANSAETASASGHCTKPDVMPSWPECRPRSRRCRDRRHGRSSPCRRSP